MLDQNSRGAKGDALEIGIHHGRSFILLSLCMKNDETAIAVDIFENQELNIEGGSGKGDYNKFMANLERFGDGKNVKILTASSLDLKKENLDPLNHGLRFISIDGGHWYDAVLNDLRLSASCAGKDCIIALDDFFHHDFPEVSAGYYAWLSEEPDFVPLCVTTSKLYLCRPGMEGRYRDAILKNEYLRFQLYRQGKFMGHSILFLTGRFSGIGGWAQAYLSFRAPATYERLKQWKKQIELKFLRPARDSRPRQE
jgi:hypothetical protein